MASELTGREVAIKTKAARYICSLEKHFYGGWNCQGAGLLGADLAFSDKDIKAMIA
jgi:hypothetical protein